MASDTPETVFVFFIALVLVSCLLPILYRCYHRRLKPRPNTLQEATDPYLEQPLRSLNRHHSLASEASNYNAWLRNGGDLPMYPGTPSMTPEPPDYNELLRASMLGDGAAGALNVPRVDLGRSPSTRSVTSVLRNDRISREVGGSIGRPPERVSREVFGFVGRPMEMASTPSSEVRDIGLTGTDGTLSSSERRSREIFVELPTG
ncbi:hypothetical protein HK096_010337 [Nowakowskiella sp. JEL0078]|nr:hypothetical protein HK096_010337 [Nowakowskiella sp. JEL0078]